MTEKASRDQFIGPHLSYGDRVAVQLDDGTLAEGYWYDGAVHDEPRKPNRPPAPWRLRCDDDGQWLIEKRQTVGYETWCRFDKGPDAFAAFAVGSAR
ncbi:hypothetical protein P5V63_24915 [Mycobacteroides abscessus subsp. abscessus]|uniref:hypothetical protein n=1 Tax=Mycobacteroides abscessus TaxID=36809 RepID=UPI00266C44DD|nr:hypothetical protein [Mycobacteroides abscessus]MDO3021028.1 hypothetical protein [Mycobacteroides abscessus subsp. abscessus]MDO3096268.1 hypothetical protein [Mycobacteroides abscessus subsp. abscessus]